MIMVVVVCGLWVVGWWFVSLSVVKWWWFDVVRCWWWFFGSWELCHDGYRGVTMLGKWWRCFQ